MVNADLKHWIGRKTPVSPLKIKSYNGVAEIARKRLGEGGIVAIPNARGPGNRLGPDYRYEEFLERAEKEAGRSIQKFGDGRFFYDSKHRIYFVKAQEVRAPLKELQGRTLVYLAYNLPFGVNLTESDARKSLEQAVEQNCIIGITATSDPIVFYRMTLLSGKDMGYFDFVVTHASTGGGGSLIEETYNGRIKGKEFVNPATGEKHAVGAIAVSGGHEARSIGSSYVVIPTLNTGNLEAFFESLKDGLRNLQDPNSEKLHKGKVPLMELVIIAWRKKVVDKLKGWR